MPGLKQLSQSWSQGRSQEDIEVDGSVTFVSDRNLFAGRVAEVFGLLLDRVKRGVLYAREVVVARQVKGI